MPSIPAKPATVRVRVWRRLQSVGAVTLKTSVYVLPNRDECVETFQWIAREITELGGQSSLCEGQFFDGVSDEDIAQRFVAARSADYASVAEEARRLAKAVKAKRLGEGEIAALGAHHAKLSKRLAEIVAIDFCHAPSRESAEGLVASVAEALERRRGGAPVITPLERIPRPRRATWVTRAGVHVDRIACAWLIARFIDPAGKLKLVPAKGYLPAKGELRFDMFDAEFTHVGDRCSFEVLLERMGLDDAALRAVGELVHDIDLRDDKFHREETPGLRSAINGICSTERDDRARIAAATPMLDALHAFFSMKARGKKGEV